ncbi:MAG TPA: hypothetical protein V6C58_08310, partial [Allocoleopsis sp.]
MVKFVNPIIRELILRFGYINGIIFGLGIDMNKILSSVFIQLFGKLPLIVQLFFTILPGIMLLLTIRKLVRTYKKGGLIGGLCVILAFGAGIILLVNVW